METKTLLSVILEIKTKHCLHIYAIKVPYCSLSLRRYLYGDKDQWKLNIP